LLVLQHACVVLDNEIGDDDVADRQSRVQPACHAGENDCVAAESVGQQCGDQRGVDLAHPRTRQDHVVPVDRAGHEDRVSCLLAVRVGQHGAKVRKFLRNRTNQSNRHTVDLAAAIDS
jgi:hypothetical protein